MKQCKLCGSPLGKEPTREELDKHWKKPVSYTHLTLPTSDLV